MSYRTEIIETGTDIDGHVWFVQEIATDDGHEISDVEEEEMLEDLPLIDGEEIVYARVVEDGDVLRVGTEVQVR